MRDGGMRRMRSKLARSRLSAIIEGRKARARGNRAELSFSHRTAQRLGLGRCHHRRRGEPHRATTDTKHSSIWQRKRDFKPNARSGEKTGCLTSSPNRNSLPLMLARSTRSRANLSRMCTEPLAPTALRISSSGTSKSQHEKTASSIQHYYQRQSPSPPIIPTSRQRSNSFQSPASPYSTQMCTRTAASASRSSIRRDHATRTAAAAHGSPR